MTGPALTLTDRTGGASIQLDAATGEVSLKYAPHGESLRFAATINTQDAREAVSLLCAGGAMPDSARPAAMAARLARLPARAESAARVVGRRLQQLLEWLATSKEDTNYTYDLTPLNLAHLAATVSVVTGRPVAEIQNYMAEPAADPGLAAHYAQTLTRLPPEMAALADPTPRWARRLGWYAAVRALKPRLVIETGIDKGHGALILCAALKRNASEGHEGRYLGTDINPHAGYLLNGAYAMHGNIMVGDSITSLRTLSQPIDLFINDSDHSADYEYNEYKTIAPLLHERSVILGDNSHATDKLTRFADETRRRFLFFREEPDRHWYAGAGIGFAFT